MDSKIIAQLLDRHVTHRDTRGMSEREETRAVCAALLEQLEAEAQTDAAAFAAELVKNGAERKLHLAKVEEVLRCIAQLDVLETQALAQARSSLLTDLPITVAAFGAAAALFANARPRLGFFALIGVVMFGQKFGRTAALTQTVRSVLGQLAVAGVTKDLGSTLEPLEKWKPMYLWMVSRGSARAICSGSSGATLESS